MVSHTWGWRNPRHTGGPWNPGHTRDAEAGISEIPASAQFSGAAAGACLCHGSSERTVILWRARGGGAQVERVAGMLNYFLLQLVGPKRKALRVSDPEKYGFHPKTLLTRVRGKQKQKTSPDFPPLPFHKSFFHSTEQCDTTFKTPAAWLIRPALLSGPSSSCI